jgi:lipooligosaccharide transport system ATP-binding protein
MDQARIVAEGSPRQLIEQHSSREVVELRFHTHEEKEAGHRRLKNIGDRQEMLPDRVLVYTDDGDAAAQAAESEGLEPAAVLVRRSTLEDVFLTLTGRTLED